MSVRLDWFMSCGSLSDGFWPWVWVWLWLFFSFFSLVVVGL